MSMETIKWVNGSVKLIDQTLLPLKCKYITCNSVPALWWAIKRLSVRGAPALGVAAGFGILLGIQNFRGKDRKKFEKRFFDAKRYLATSRPTAVNLFNVLEEMEDVLRENPESSVAELKRLLKKKALAVYEEDRRVCRAMGAHGARLIKKNDHVMTVCNAGALATVDFGTALGVMYSAKQSGKKFKVFACETRPLLQGARLTAWELLRGKIDTTLICDNMAATLMQQGRVDIIFTGADRIAFNGDTANKIGTYMLAVLAHYHKVPLYVVAPQSTFDLNIKTGAEIPIEERKKEEVTSFGKRPTAPLNVKVYNPAFDVTDHRLIAGIVTEHGIIRPPFKTNIKKILK